MMLTASDSTTKNVALLPTTLFASAVLPAPIHWATKTVVAIEKPNIAPNSMNITTFELPTAANAASPRNLPIHMAFTEPFSDCRTLPTRIGSAKYISARGIEPSINENFGRTHTPDRKKPKVG